MTKKISASLWVVGLVFWCMALKADLELDADEKSVFPKT
jgi:hypothetical protein